MTPRKKYPPLTSETTLKKARKDIAKQNRSRAKDMERRIAQVLRGRRIPMSGAAAAFKGDVEIPLINHPGKYIIECKLSSQRNVHDQQRISAYFEWFRKLRYETEAMNAAFGVLIIHYFRGSNDYVFIRREDIQLFIERYNKIELLPLLTLEGLDVRLKANGAMRVGFDVNKNSIDSRMNESHVFIPAAKYILPDTEYIVLYLSDFRMLMGDV